MKPTKPKTKLNVWVARCVPFIVFGVAGYISWVITKLICVDYLLRPQPSILTHPRRSPAIAILTIFYLLLCFMLLCYGRLLDAVARTPGYVPRGPQYYVEKQRQKSWQTQVDGEKRNSQASNSTSTGQEHTVTVPVKGGSVIEYWKRDVFACNFDGRPNYCSVCQNYKPERSHHCSEVNRCVRRMDHFCPWVGGVVGETSFKFFIQFTFWAATLCLHILISIAYFFAERKRVYDALNANWAVAMGLAGIFFLFAGGMCISSLQFAFQNSSTIENLSRKRKVWYLAIYIPEHRMQQVVGTCGGELRLITYPRPEHEQLQFAAEQDAGMYGLNMQSQSNIIPPGPLRTFGIFATGEGESPWDLGARGNWQDVMGYTIWEWFLPFCRSPWTDHESMECYYKLGPLVEKMKREAGITKRSETT